MLYILNSLIVPINFDRVTEATVKFKRIGAEEAQRILRTSDYVSVIGHESTSKVLSRLLETEIKFNRATIFMDNGDKGIHFYLKERLPEGAVLSETELEKLKYWLVLSEVKT